MNYKVTNSFSSILKAKYSDGTEIEIDFETEFSKHVLSAELARDSIAQGAVGRGGRIFPTLLTARTVPRLWAAMQEALVVQDEAFRDFAKLAVTGVMFALSVPAMPAGAAPGVGAGGSGLRATRRAIPRTGAPSAVAAAELKAIEALRAANPQLRNLTNEELLAIRWYTGEGWARINAALRGASDSSALPARCRAACCPA